MFESLTDAHCHADFGEFAETGGLDAGMPLCAAACFYKDWEALKNFNAGALPVKKAFGIHPDSDISEGEIFSERICSEFSACLGIADAVGEAGLDGRVGEKFPMDAQKRIFEMQLALAKCGNLPAIIHCVGAWGPLSDALKKSGVKKFLIHAAKCPPELVSEFGKWGGYFSFGLRELESKKGALCARAAAPDRILVESDSVPSREKIFQAVVRLAEIRGENDVLLSEQIFENFNTFYSK